MQELAAPAVSTGDEGFTGSVFFSTGEGPYRYGVNPPIYMESLPAPRLRRWGVRWGR